MPERRLLKLTAVATAAGLFSGSFGVGGGSVIVPLLILWLAYGEREATGTSLAAIVVIALFAVVGHGLYGNVDIPKGALIAVPAVVGVVAGTTIQQRVPERAIGLVFALLLAVVAIELLVG